MTDAELYPVEWLDTTRHPADLLAWRGVEAQHIVSTMRLVDTLDEQDALEALLEKSKPALPFGAEGKHYLLSTPFRYRSPFGSRFRRRNVSGVWYGAAELETACAETAYWAWRFLMDSTGLLDDDLVTQRSFFRAQVSGSSIDLMAPPWVDLEKHWRHPADYSSTQALGDAARASGIGWIRYESVRHPTGVCCAVLDVACLAQLDQSSLHTWQCKTTRNAVLMVSDRARFRWDF